MWCLSENAAIAFGSTGLFLSREKIMLQNFPTLYASSTSDCLYCSPTIARHKQAFRSCRRLVRGSLVLCTLFAPLFFVNFVIYAAMENDKYFVKIRDYGTDAADHKKERAAGHADIYRRANGKG